MNEYSPLFNASKCIVAKCPNYRHEGAFVGELCGPCYEAITTSKPLSHCNRNNFISRLPWLKSLVRELTDMAAETAMQYDLRKFDRLETELKDLKEVNQVLVKKLRILELQDELRQLGAL